MSGQILIELRTDYRVPGIARSGEIYWLDDIAEEWNGGAIDADNTALNYDRCRIFDGRSRLGVVRAWLDIWQAPGVSRKN